MRYYHEWLEGGLRKALRGQKEKVTVSSVLQSRPRLVLEKQERMRPAFTPHHPFLFLSSHKGYLRPLVIHNFQMWLISLMYLIRYYVRSQRPTQGTISLFQQGITRDCTVARPAWLLSLEPDPEGGRVVLLGGGEVHGLTWMGKGCLFPLKIITKIHHTPP